MTEIKTVTVIGAGIMGSGMAQVIAKAGYLVNLIDISPTILENARKNIISSLSRLARREVGTDPSSFENYKQNALKKLNFSTKLEDGVHADLIIEAIIENLNVKQELFGKLDKMCPEHTILATNTSALTVTEIGKYIKRKNRYGGLHFFNPVPMVPLLEVIKTAHTSEQTHKAMLEFGSSIGKTCVSCKDTPGFIVNRILSPMFFEAMSMYDRGDASAEDIDTAMQYGAGHPIGPLALIDLVGLDTCNHIVDANKHLIPNFKPIGILEKLVAEGKLGRKTGEGFYKYETPNAKAKL